MTASPKSQPRMVPPRPGPGHIRPRSGGTQALFVLILTVQSMLGFFSFLQDSVTYDELTHFTSGVSYWQTLDFRLDPENPPLVQYWSTLPLQFIAHPPIPTTTPFWKAAGQWDVARDWFCHRTDGERLLVLGRAQMLLLSLGLSATVYAAAKRLFDSNAALMSAAVVALWPTLLAHGRLVTSDVPLALFALLALWRVSALLHEPSVWRWMSAAAACAALALTKFSFVLVLPALGIVWLASCLAAQPSARRWLRNAMLMASLAISTWVLIWAAYGTRFSMFADDVEDITTLDDQDARLEQRRYWIQMLNVAAEHHNQVWLPFLVERLEAWRLLPEAYLFGFTYTLHSAHSREAFLMGEYSDHGWWYYFPVAFVLKTPLPVQALLLIGVGLLLCRMLVWPVAARFRAALADARTPLVAGLLTFTGIYIAVSLTSRINIGERHLAPLYPMFGIAIGAVSWAWSKRSVRWLTIGLLAWLTIETIASFPHYLSYKSGLLWGRPLHEYLSDSNVDWGQDLKRVARYAANHPEESINLSYFGRVDPASYVRAANFVSHKPFQPPSTLDPGTYIVSATQQVGVYEFLVRPQAWQDPQSLRAFEQLREIVSRKVPGDASPQSRAQHEVAAQEYKHVRACLLLSRLRWRTPDERIGRSMFVHRLSAQELEELTSLQPDLPTGSPSGAPQR